MQFSESLIQGTLVKRYKRFLADVKLSNGEVVTAHCPNTGSMTGCAEPGWTVYLSPSNNPKRKLKYTWEMVVTDQNHWIGINTHKANSLVEEGISNKVIQEFKEYSTLKREVKYGKEKSRIDFLLQGDGLQDCYIEVKSVTLLEDQKGYFPDAVTSRGQKHLRELMNIVDTGNKAALIFCVQHTGIKQVSPAQHVDHDYADLLEQAIAKGVEVLVYGSSFSLSKIEITDRLDLKM